MADDASAPVPDSLEPPLVDARRHAKHLYFMGWQVVSIAAFLDQPRATVASWKARDKWDDAKPIDRIEGTLEVRLQQLILKPIKSGSDFKEIDLLGRQVVQMARVRRFNEPGGRETDLSPDIAKRNAGPKHKPTRNTFSPEQVLQLRKIFHDTLFNYQRAWWAAKDERTRVLLKSRQIGATWYFAREALIDAIETGRNQVFLSASKSQAHVFRQYIVAFAKEVGVELTGDPIVLDNGATLYFLGTNARTAQGYHGNFYFDEFFWTFRFQELNKVASGMALHKKWRKTYLSTPSSVNHEAYPFWTGDLFNRRRPKDEKFTFDTSWQALANGARGPDKVWRQIVTIEDAEKGGCDLFDIEELRFEYSPDQFANLLMCEFIDDALSVFPLAVMAGCMVDSWVDWDNYSPLAARPVGNAPVSVGYDPSLTGDGAAATVIGLPAIVGKGKFKLLEKMLFRGMDFAAQAEGIRQLTLRYNVVDIAIDCTGMGIGVYQLVKQFFPNARAINYSPEVKTALVLKASDTIRRGRFEYDAGATDVTQSFMAIRKTLTASGRSVTYDAGRSEETGHADLAWAVMHALSYEPLEAPIGGPQRGFLEFYE